MGASHHLSLLLWIADHVLFLSNFQTLLHYCSLDWCRTYVITWASVGGIRSWIRMVQVHLGIEGPEAKASFRILNWQWSQSGLCNVRISSISGGFFHVAVIPAVAFRNEVSLRFLICDLQNDSRSGCPLQNREWLEPEGLILACIWERANFYPWLLWQLNSHFGTYGLHSQVFWINDLIISLIEKKMYYMQVLCFCHIRLFSRYFKLNMSDPPPKDLDSGWGCGTSLRRTLYMCRLFWELHKLHWHFF